MKPFFLFLLTFSFYHYSFGQITFRHTFGGASHDQGRSVKQTSDGGYIVAGSTSSFGYGNSDVYVIKLDSFGLKEWSNVYGGEEIDWGQSVVQTADSGFVVAGYTNSFGSGGYDVYLIKVDKLGNLLWQKTLGGADWDFAYSLQQTNDGGFIIAGESYSFGNGNNDMYLIKTDANGNLSWSKTYGGNEKDYAKSVKQTFDGGYILAGGTSSYGNGENDLWLIKTDSNGDSLWARTFGDTLQESANAVGQTYIDSGFIAVGNSNSFNSTGNSDYYFVKTDFNGNLMWYYAINVFMDDDYSADVYPLPDGRNAVLGSTKSTGTVGYVYQFMITQPTGWVIMGLGGPYGSAYYDALSFSLDTTNDSGFILCGSTDGYGKGYNDIFIVKLDTLGHADSTAVISYGDTINSTFVFSPQFTFYSRISIYPNPVSDRSYLTYNKTAIEFSEIFEIRIMDVTGRVRDFYRGDLNGFYINSSNFSPGLYFAIIKSSNMTFSLKFAVVDVQ